MDKLREIIRPAKESNLSCRMVAEALHISKTAVSQYISEFSTTEFSYSDIKNLSDSKLAGLLGSKKKKSKRYEKLKSYFCYFAKEIKRKGVTLYLLWEEYIANNPGGYSCARAYWHYRVWRQVFCRFYR